jgi:hypothetical protein
MRLSDGGERRGIAEPFPAFRAEYTYLPICFDIAITFYPAMTAFTDQYSLPNIFFDIGQL